MVAQERADGKHDSDMGGAHKILWDGVGPLYGSKNATAAYCMKHANLGSHLAEVVTGG